ncbi:hypothetical protein BMF94_1948 [Rhodotorula taiwanensis]|uniref:Uncharacterized protein n=1 Tax=Rhodotorula taiwanensis TaxID=741276 RepID=A0A2S5BDX2_9BASI|nr:hypothetical protein BMF94_1948 [Rhodotorula taiwanensis]
MLLRSSKGCAFPANIGQGVRSSSDRNARASSVSRALTDRTPQQTSSGPVKKMRSPFSCFGSHGYDATLPRHGEPNRQHRYSTAALPPLQASSHPNRRPAPVRKESIGSPTDFEHVSHNVLPRSSERDKENLTDDSASAPKRSAFEQDDDHNKQDSAVGARERPFSKRASLPPQMAFARARLEASPSPEAPVPTASPIAPLKVKRKVPPAVTMSVIRSAGGTDAIARTGLVPSRLLSLATGLDGPAGPESPQGSATASKLLLRELFSPSELEALSAASNGERASTIQAKLDKRMEDAEGSALYDTETTKAFKGALKEIEDALRREISEGSYGPI